MIKFNAKTILIILGVISIATVGVAVGWYNDITATVKDNYLSANKTTTWPAWFWVRLVLWPAIMILIVGVVFYLNEGVLVEIGVGLFMVIAITGLVLSLFTGSYEGVKNDVYMGNTFYILLTLGYASAIFANSFIAYTLFKQRKELRHSGKEKTQQILNEEIAEIQ